MNWRVDYSKDAHKFIVKHRIQEMITQELKKFLLKLEGQNSSIDVKKLWSEWAGYYRIRKGTLRIIFMMDVTEHVIFVERVDFRGNVYK